MGRQIHISRMASFWIHSHITILYAIYIYMFNLYSRFFFVFCFSNDRAEQPLNLNNGTCKFPFAIQYNEEVSDTPCPLKKGLYVNKYV